MTQYEILKINVYVFMQKNRMHVSISSRVSSVFDEVLLVGQTYLIENFAVASFNTKYKCVEGDSHIIFTHMTKANPVPHVDRLRLDYIFDFTHLSRMNESYFQDSHCIGMSH